jgi:hypothetical protein
MIYISPVLHIFSSVVDQGRSVSVQSERRIVRRYHVQITSPSNQDCTKSGPIAILGQPDMMMPESSRCIGATLSRMRFGMACVSTMDTYDTYLVA